MSVRSILVPLCPGLAAGPPLDAARLVALRAEGHIDAAFIRPDPETVFAALPKVAAACGVTVAGIEQEGREAAAAARAAFEAWRDRHSLPAPPAAPMLRGSFAGWSERTGTLEVEIVRAGRLHDLTVLPMPPWNGARDGAADRAFDAAVFDTARPVLLVPPRVPDDLLRHVAVAWNGSLQATRAAAAALPLLRAADRVSVLTAASRPVETAEQDGFLDAAALPVALQWHGIQAHALRPKPAGLEAIGATLLRTAAEHGATMLVMGAFTRSRLRNMLLGGVTRHVLQCAQIPVLMAH